MTKAQTEIIDDANTNVEAIDTLEECVEKQQESGHEDKPSASRLQRAGSFGE